MNIFKTKNQFFQDFVSREVQKMLSESDSVKTITHTGLKGTFREFSLSNFLKNFLPLSFGVGSGQIQDCYGNQSPETDLLIWDKNLLPPIISNDTLGIYPLESCVYYFEIKTEINATNIKDAINKAWKIENLTFLQTYQNPKTRIAKIFFAYTSDSDSIDELERFNSYFSGRKKNPPFDAICVVGKGYWSFGMAPKISPDPVWAYFHSDDKNYEVIALLGGILNSLAGSYRPSFGYYILDPEESGKAEFIKPENICKSD